MSPARYQLRHDAEDFGDGFIVEVQRPDAPRSPVPYSGVRSRGIKILDAKKPARGGLGILGEQGYQIGKPLACRGWFSISLMAGSSTLETALL